MGPRNHDYNNNSRMACSHDAFHSLMRWTEERRQTKERDAFHQEVDFLFVEFKGLGDFSKLQV